MKIIQGDALEELKKMPSESVDCIVTSPPYFALRDYGVRGQIGLEASPELYIFRLMDVFNEAKRVLKKTGTCWVNIGDTYFGGGRNAGNHNPKVKSKAVRGLVDLGDSVPGPKGQKKSLAQIPSRFALAMTERGWILRNEIIWHKPNCMPASVKDRFTVDFEKMFFFTKTTTYFFDQQFEQLADSTRKDPRIIAGSYTTQRRKRGYTGDAQQGSGMLKPNKKGRNKRSVWAISTKPYKEAHFAVFPQELVETPIKAGCPKGGVVLDMFAGSGTTLIVADRGGIRLSESSLTESTSSSLRSAKALKIRSRHLHLRKKSIIAKATKQTKEILINDMTQNLRAAAKIKQPIMAGLYDEFILWAAMPYQEQVKLGIKTQTEFARQNGIDDSTLTRWKDRDDYRPRIKALRDKWGFDKTGAVLNSVYRWALKGNPLSQITWLKYFEGFDQKEGNNKIEKVDFGVDDITFLIDGLPEPMRTEHYDNLRKLLDDATMVANARTIEVENLEQRHTPEVPREANIVAQDVSFKPGNEVAIGNSPSVLEDLAGQVSPNNYQSAARWW